jgi:hypothetical protein
LRQRDADSDAYGNCNGYSHTYTDCNTNSHGNSYCYCNSNSYSHCHGNSDCASSVAHAHGDAQTYADAEAAAHAPSAGLIGALKAGTREKNLASSQRWDTVSARTFTPLPGRRRMQERQHRQAISCSVVTAQI